MAGFRMHVGTSTLLGCGYAGTLALGYGVPVDTAIVSGAMCGFAGMLPDLDSDYGVPLRETMAFTAATIPMLMVRRFHTVATSMGLGFDAMALATVATYLFVRFGVTTLIRKYTVHRGMFHSIPAMLIFGGIAFLICGDSPLDLRCFKAGGVIGGCLSHLLLDEIYAVEYAGGRWRFKKSFGTALKLWGDNRWSNMAAYSKLALVAMAILGEPSVMQRLEQTNPQFAAQVNEIRTQIQAAAPNNLQQNANSAAKAAVNFFNNAAQGRQAGGNNTPASSAWPQFLQSQPQQLPPANNSQYAGPQQGYAPPQNYPLTPVQPPANMPAQWQWPSTNSYDTAQRPAGSVAQ